MGQGHAPTAVHGAPGGVGQALLSWCDMDRELPAARPTILIAEDDVAIREILRRCGYYQGSAGATLERLAKEPTCS